MEPSQPIIRPRRRTRATDRALSRFVDSQAETSRAPATTNAVSSTDSISTPREPPDVAKVSSDALESLTSASAQNGDDARRVLASQPAFEPSQELIPSTLPDPTSAQRRYKHNPITYKRRRSMRTRAVSVSVSVTDPSTQPEPPREPTQHQSRASTQPQLLDNADELEPEPEPSPSPAPPSTQSYSPTPVPAQTRKRRRRRLPPLKNRLARVARSRLARARSREKWSQSPVPVPVPVPEPSEYGEEELDVEPEQPNVVRRRLTAPENYTIPDLKDLVSSHTKPSVFVPAARPLRPTQPIHPATQRPTHPATQYLDLTTPHKPTPRFALPPRNTIHASRTPYGSKSPRKPKKGDAPRLNFVALETHQEQATTRRGTSVFGTHRLPLARTPQTSPTRKTVTYDLDEIHEISRPFESSSNRSPARSLSRVLVKDTPEPEICVPKRLDFASAATSQRIQAPEPQPEREPEAPSANATTQPRSSPSAAPMSELYDNLVKLARSAEQMGKRIFPPAPEPFNDLKRKFQTTLTPQLTLEAAPPTKVPRLE